MVPEGGGGEFGDVPPVAHGISRFNQRQLMVGDAYYDQQYYDQEHDGNPNGLENDEGINDDYFYQKERELKELNDLRIRTLEKLVREKIDVIHA